MEPTGFSVVVENDGNRVVIRPIGELDLACQLSWSAAMDEVAAVSQKSVVIDLDRVTFMDSTGLQLILVAWKKLQADGIRLTIENPRGPVVRLGQISGVFDAVNAEPG